MSCTKGNTPNPYQFTGEQFDTNLRLYNLRARYYNTDVGRFWSRDSLEVNPNDPRELNRYVYVTDNPVNRVDPSGQFGEVALQQSQVSVPNIPTISAKGVTVFVVLAVTAYVLYAKIKSGQAHRQEKNQIKSAAKHCGVDPREFGDFVEEWKYDNNIPPREVLAYRVLLALAELFKEEKDGC